MIVVVNGDSTKCYPELTKEKAVAKFKDEVSEGSIEVLSIEGSMVERLTEDLEDDQETVSHEWSEVGHVFEKE